MGSARPTPTSVTRSVCMCTVCVWEMNGHDIRVFYAIGRGNWAPRVLCVEQKATSISTRVGHGWTGPIINSSSCTPEGERSTYSPAHTHTMNHNQGHLQHDDEMCLVITTLLTIAVARRLVATLTLIFSGPFLAPNRFPPSFLITAPNPKQQPSTTTHYHGKSPSLFVMAAPDIPPIHPPTHPIISTQTVALVLAQDGTGPPHAGGAQEWGHVQWPLGLLRHLDEHYVERRHLHIAGTYICTWKKERKRVCFSFHPLTHPSIAGRRPLLEDPRMLRPRQQHQVPPRAGRDCRHGERGGPATPTYVGKRIKGATPQARTTHSLIIFLLLPMYRTRWRRARARAAGRRPRGTR